MHRRTDEEIPGEGKKQSKRIGFVLQTDLTLADCSPFLKSNTK
jgi:hypothetical protein